jgi:hypothetical protein
MRVLQRRPGLTTEYGTLRERLGPFDLVMLEIGAFHPSWGDIHLGPENALEAHALLGVENVSSVHWGTFALALHDWEQPAEALWRRPCARPRLLMPRWERPSSGHEAPVSRPGGEPPMHSACWRAPREISGAEAAEAMRGPSIKRSHRANARWRPAGSPRAQSGSKVAESARKLARHPMGWLSISVDPAHARARSPLRHADARQITFPRCDTTGHAQAIAS